MHVILDDSAQIRATQTHPLAEVESNRQREKNKPVQTTASDTTTHVQDNRQRYHDPCPIHPLAAKRATKTKTTNDKRQTKRMTKRNTRTHPLAQATTRIKSMNDFPEIPSERQVQDKISSTSLPCPPGLPVAQGSSHPVFRSRFSRS